MFPEQGRRDVVESEDVVHVVRGCVPVRMGGGRKDQDRTELAARSESCRETRRAGADDEDVEEFGRCHDRLIRLITMFVSGC